MKKYLFVLLMALMSLAAYAEEPYAVLSNDGQTVTFYYDSQKASRSGVVEINNRPVIPTMGWTNPYSNSTKAVIDASFTDYLPTSTAYWFFGCEQLTSITGIEYLNTANVTEMGCMFYDCYNLTSLDVSRFKTDNVKSMGCMFYGCSKLTSLDVSGFNTENVTKMLSMFQNCSKLTSLDVSGFKTDKVTDMRWMFHNCFALTDLDVRGFKTDNVTNMDNMFYFCQGLTSLDLSGFKTDNVTNMQRMFQACISLTTIYIGDGWSTKNVTSSANMFAGCYYLVGGAGTGYDASIEDVTYARIDGGADNPGYFTCKGDANGDGKTNVADIVEALNLIKADTYKKGADLNNDGKVDSTDVDAIAKVIISAK